MVKASSLSLCCHGPWCFLCTCQRKSLLCPTLAASPQSNSWECCLFSRWDQISLIWTAETFHCAVHAGGKAQDAICCWPDSTRESLAFLISRLFLQKFSSLYSCFYLRCLGLWPDSSSIWGHTCVPEALKGWLQSRLGHWLGRGAEHTDEPLLQCWCGTVLPT